MTYSLDEAKAQADRLRQIVEDKSYRLDTKEKNEMISSHICILVDSVGGQPVLHKGAWTFKDGTNALKKAVRIVVGAHGPYVEFDKDDAEFEMHIPENQTWRLDPKYSNLKYHHYEPIGRTEKIYLQKGLVKYADYQVGKYYIDFYQLNMKD